ncbi:MAG TPA: regulatory protein RecX, partial [Streptosporangiaceae bacterium]
FPARDSFPVGDGTAASERTAAGGGAPVPARGTGRRATANRATANRATAGRAGGGEGQLADPAERARELCLRLLTGRPRTRTELASAMSRHGIPGETAAAVLARFTDAGLIDDAAFARAWVESRHHSRGLARRALSAELTRRGVDGQDIEAAMSALDPAEELATARHLVDKALRASRGRPLPTRIRRLVGLLARKGYPAPVAYRIVREAIEQEGIDAAGAGVDLDDAAWATPDADLDAG